MYLVKTYPTIRLHVGLVQQNIINAYPVGGGEMGWRKAALLYTLLAVHPHLTSELLRPVVRLFYICRLEVARLNHKGLHQYFPCIIS